MQLCWHYCGNGLGVTGDTCQKDPVTSAAKENTCILPSENSAAVSMPAPSQLLNNLVVAAEEEKCGCQEPHVPRYLGSAPCGGSGAWEVTPLQTALGWGTAKGCFKGW